MVLKNGTQWNDIPIWESINDITIIVSKINEKRLPSPMLTIFKKLGNKICD